MIKSPTPKPTDMSSYEPTSREIKGSKSKSSAKPSARGSTGDDTPEPTYYETTRAIKGSKLSSPTFEHVGAAAREIKGGKNKSASHTVESVGPSTRVIKGGKNKTPSPTDEPTVILDEIYDDAVGTSEPTIEPTREIKGMMMSRRH
jgi:hypothetical protein